MISDLITENVSRCQGIRIVYLPDSDMFTLLRNMPDLAVQRLSSSQISRVSVQRALILRGLLVMEDGFTFPERDEGAWRSSCVIPVPSWLDQLIYEIADREARSMSEIAQTALELGRAQVLSSR